MISEIKIDWDYLIPVASLSIAFLVVFSILAVWWASKLSVEDFDDSCDHHRRISVTMREISTTEKETE